MDRMIPRWRKRMRAGRPSPYLSILAVALGAWFILFVILHASMLLTIVVIILCIWLYHQMTSWGARRDL
jgi:membrane-bound ClpP family serine protease